MKMSIFGVWKAQKDVLSSRRLSQGGSIISQLTQFFCTLVYFKQQVKNTNEYLKKLVKSLKTKLPGKFSFAECYIYEFPNHCYTFQDLLVVKTSQKAPIKFYFMPVLSFS